MSSSSSIAAARRRRTGPPPSSTSSSTNTPSQSVPGIRPGQTPPPSNQNTSPNPYMILQQHHVKINSIEQAIHNLVSQSKTQSSVASNVNNGQPVDIDNISETILSRLDSQLNLNVLYENDERLSTEIENLNKVIHNQQMTINGLNQTLYYILQQLDITAQSDVTSELITGDSNQVKSSVAETGTQVSSDNLSDEVCNSNNFPPPMPDELLSKSV